MNTELQIATSRQGITLVGWRNPDGSVVVFQIDADGTSFCIRVWDEN